MRGVGFRRGMLDVLVPAMAIFACIALPLGIYEGIRDSQGIQQARPISGVVESLNDRAPYADRRDRFWLEYPVIQYRDYAGITRSLTPRNGSLPGYFHVGEKLSLGMIEGQFVVLDRWYVWQGKVVLILFYGTFLLATFGYYRTWRLRMIAEEKANP